MTTYISFRYLGLHCYITVATKINCAERCRSMRVASFVCSAVILDITASAHDLD